MARLSADELRLRESIRKTLSARSFGAIPVDRRATLAAEFVWQWLAEQQSDQFNRGKPWIDDALRVVRQEAPTHANIVKLARAFGRSAGSVEQIYRWAATTDKEVEGKRPDDAFIAQIKRIAKEVGWEAF